MVSQQLKLFRIFVEGQEHFFQSKMAAKEFGGEQGLKGAFVHRGPDHWLGPTDGTSKQIPSSKRGW